MSRIAKRYAKALFKIAGGDLGKAKKQRDNLVALKELFNVKDSGRVLRSPVMPADLKKSLLDYGLEQAGASDDVKKLVHTVLSAGRVETLPEIADAYSAFIDEAEGVARGDVVSAVPLKPEDVQQIASALGQIIHKKVNASAQVDGNLLGGFVAKVGNYRVDLSLKTKLEGLAASAVEDSPLTSQSLV